jgi:hypothetical protein
MIVARGKQCMVAETGHIRRNKAVLISGLTLYLWKRRSAISAYVGKISRPGVTLITSGPSGRLKAKKRLARRLARTP